jgi:hypothetical protein
MRYTTQLFLAAATFIVSSCSTDFLTLAPISNANVDNFYQSESDFKLAVNGAYVSLRSNGIFQDYVQLIGDMHSDNATVGTTAGARTSFYEMSEFNDQPSSTIFSSVWNDHYQGISRCNMILDRIGGVAFTDESKKNVVIGEARFLRGLMYFNLVRIFGDVPLVLHELKSIDDSYAQGRTPVGEIYEAIVADLLFAAQNLPVNYTGVDVGRVTSGASKGLLGKVYLTQKKFPEAAKVLAEVVSSGQYQLLPNFSDLWKTANKNSKEALFEVQFKKQAGVNTGSSYSSRYTPYLSGVALIGFETTSGGFNIPTEDIVNAYSSTDLRKTVSVATSYTNQTGMVITGLSGRYTKKFLGAYTNGQGAEDNWPVLRYADVLLMYAEALNEVGFQPDGDAFKHLNTVRTRAGLPALSSTSADSRYRISDQPAFRLAVETERRLELAFEGHRWFDLVRTGRALEVLKMKKPIKEFQLLMPIPQQQLDINPKTLKQNPGY